MGGPRLLPKSSWIWAHYLLGRARFMSFHKLTSHGEGLPIAFHTCIFGYFIRPYTRLVKWVVSPWNGQQIGGDLILFWCGSCAYVVHTLPLLQMYRSPANPRCGYILCGALLFIPDPLATCPLSIYSFIYTFNLFYSNRGSSFCLSMFMCSPISTLDDRVLICISVRK